MSERVPITVTVNGRSRSVSVAPHHTLLEVLRDDLGLTGAKECCLVGECGACTVRLDGRIVDSCLVLGIEADGREVETVEGLASGGRLSTLQQAFLDHAAAQCGYCIPGQLMAASSLLDDVPSATRAGVDDGLAGNLCRCGAYQQIAEAVMAAAAGAVTTDGSPAVGGTSSRQTTGHDPAAVPDASVAPQ